jgi:hypothetical protein
MTTPPVGRAERAGDRNSDMWFDKQMIAHVTDNSLKRIDELKRRETGLFERHDLKHVPFKLPLDEVLRQRESMVRPDEWERTRIITPPSLPRDNPPSLPSPPRDNPLPQPPTPWTRRQERNVIDVGENLRRQLPPLKDIGFRSPEEPQPRFTDDVIIQLKERLALPRPIELLESGRRRKVLA